MLIEKSRLPQGIILSPTCDQPVHNGTKSFIYADDMCKTDQYPTFSQVENTIEQELGITEYYINKSQRANPEKMQVTAFHLRNREHSKYHGMELI